MCTWITAFFFFFSTTMLTGGKLSLKNKMFHSILAQRKLNECNNRDINTIIEKNQKGLVTLSKGASLDTIA